MWPVAEERFVFGITSDSPQTQGAIAAVSESQQSLPVFPLSSYRRSTLFGHYIQHFRVFRRCFIQTSADSSAYAVGTPGPVVRHNARKLPYCNGHNLKSARNCVGPQVGFKSNSLLAAVLNSGIPRVHHAG